MEKIERKVGVSYPVLVPNMTGFQGAVSGYHFNKYDN